MYIFDESDVYYRSPSGAVDASGTLTLHIKLRRGETINPRVCLYPDGGETREVAMEYCHVTGVYDVYKLDLNFYKAGLYWYHFLIDTTYDVTFTVPEYAGGGFQVTVYEPEAVQPEWIWGGTIYHIFVDRFCNGSGDKFTPGAVHRADWGGCPYFMPDEMGIVRNNDFFGGDLYGIIEKLPYLEELGITCIYLSPVFEADSNHKYDTGDFLKVDAAFGGDEALEELCKKADEHGMKVILDGVFNHVGSDSVYFNRYGKYDSVGAYQDHHSPYRDWFMFKDDGTYESWWGIELLPAVNKNNAEYRDFLCGNDGVIAHWTRKGVAGWRLDVVDEIPDSLLDPLCVAMRRENKDVYIAGEVWEDASHKIAYSARRRYFLGGQLSSVTNYPLKHAIIACVKDGNINELASTMSSLCKNYPKHVLDSLMNIVGTHDTMRILTMLSGANFPEGKLAMSHFRLSSEQIALAKKRLRLASALQFTLPGVPCLYYGDEAGMEGGADPFNRVCYPWGHEDKELISWYSKLSKIRKQFGCFKDGRYNLIEARDGLFAFTRGEDDDRVLVAVNVSDKDRVINAKNFTFDLLKDEQVGGSASQALIIKAGNVGIFS
ncbi:MAG: glycoside hydrolase family 13 protein [Oscillospiraceae bacterium]|jgi:glycosidase|nr:glycoside hydrolase family 13 protein [Oscillospiraceae bacterium]